MRYEVAYTPKGSQAPSGSDRSFELYTNKKIAIRRALKLLAEGCTDIFVDYYDGDDDLVDYVDLSNGDLIFIKTLI